MSQFTYTLGISGGMIIHRHRHEYIIGAPDRGIR